jgi:hypothetical protein
MDKEKVIPVQKVEDKKYSVLFQKRALYESTISKAKLEEYQKDADKSFEKLKKRGY